MDVRGDWQARGYDTMYERAATVKATTNVAVVLVDDDGAAEVARGWALSEAIEDGLVMVTVVTLPLTVEVATLTLGSDAV